MKVEDFDRIVAGISADGAVDAGLLDAYRAYVKRNYDAFHPFRPLFQSALDREEPFSPEEQALRRRLEEARERETFSDLLIRLMREKGLSAPQVYHAAGIDARHFSKIISNRRAKPKKPTVVVLAIALHLSLQEACSFVSKAGYSLGDTDLFDVSMKFFFETGCYDRKTIDAIMEKFDLPLLPQKW